MRISAHQANSRPQIRPRFGMLAFPALSGLGLGQTCTYDDEGNEICDDGSSTSSDGIDLTGLQNLDTGASSSLLPISLNVSSGASSPSSSSTFAQDLAAFGTAASGVSKAVNASQSPYVIPGTSLVYNPATGGIAGTSATSTAVAGAVTSLGSMLPIIGVVILVGFLLESMGGKK